MHTLIDLRRHLADAVAWRPEWPAAVIAVAAWIALIAMGSSTSSPTAWTHGGHHTHQVVPHVSTAQAGAAEAAMTLPQWALMSMAMMIPVTLPAVRHVAVNSIRGRRWRAMTIYLATYVGVWVVVGGVGLILLAWARVRGVEQSTIIVVALAAAAAWQLTPWKRRAVASCARTVPLPPVGLRADVACAWFGVRQGARCAVSCGPLMLLMAVLAHANLLAMAVLSVIIAAEKLTRFRAKLIKPVGAMLVVATIAAAEIALLT